jgi:hypothetical protein
VNGVGRQHASMAAVWLQVYAVTKTRAVQLSGSAFQISHARCGMLVCWAPKFPEGLLEGQLALLGRDGSRI